MIKTVGSGVLGVVLAVVGGVVDAGDRAIHAAIAVFSNEFIMMALTIAVGIALLKS